MIFDKPVYENLTKDYINFIYYYISKKCYNGVISDLHKKCYDDFQEENEASQPTNINSSPQIFLNKENEYTLKNSEENKLIINIRLDFYSRYFNFAKSTQKTWEKIFHPLEIELQYLYEIHSQFYNEFEKDEYINNNLEYNKLEVYPSSYLPVTASSLLCQPFTLKISTNTDSKTFLFTESPKKTIYLHKIKNKIILEIHKWYAEEFDPSSIYADTLPCYLYSQYPRKPHHPSSIHYYNYLSNKTTRNYFAEAITTSNIMEWL